VEKSGDLRVVGIDLKLLFHIATDRNFVYSGRFL